MFEAYCLANTAIYYFQEIAERVPADPLEAEILAMAEAISGAKTGDSDTDEYENEDYSAGQCMYMLFNSFVVAHPVLLL